MVAVFVDLKATVELVDRMDLIKVMRGRGVRNELIVRMEEIYRKTRNRIKVGGELGNVFWTARGVRQGCLLSPTLFNLMLVDLEEVLKKLKWRVSR